MAYLARRVIDSRKSAQTLLSYRPGGAQGLQPPNGARTDVLGGPFTYVDSRPPVATGGIQSCRPASQPIVQVSVAVLVGTVAWQAPP
jgi:hypothetical protein